MSKLSNDTAKDSERYKTLGFKSQFDGKPAGMPWAELIEELKTNVLRQPLRVRKLIMGEYDTKSEADDIELAKAPAKVPDDWDGPTQTRVSEKLMPERKADLIHKNKSPKEIEQDTKTTLFKSCAYQLTKLTDDKERAYEFWYAITTGEVRSKVEQRGVLNVNDIFGELQTDYGQAMHRGRWCNCWEIWLTNG